MGGSCRLVITKASSPTITGLRVPGPLRITIGGTTEDSGAGVHGLLAASLLTGGRGVGGFHETVFCPNMHPGSVLLWVRFSKETRDYGSFQIH